MHDKMTASSLSKLSPATLCTYHNSLLLMMGLPTPSLTLGFTGISTLLNAMILTIFLCYLGLEAVLWLSDSQSASESDTSGPFKVVT